MAKKRSSEGHYEDDGRWDLFDPDRSYAIWMLMENTEWKHLPDTGSLLDQEEMLLQDLSTISYVSQVVEKMLKEDEADGAN